MRETHRREITSSITLIEGGAFPHSNSLLIDDQVLVDTGAPVELGLEPAFIINSHCHPDHTSGNHQYSVPILAHPHAAPMIQDFNIMKRELGVEESGWPQLIKRLTGWQPAPTQPIDEPVIQAGETRIKVIHTPGHSPGHVCLEIDDILFTADIDLTGFGPWYGFENSNVDDFIRSIKLVIDMEPEVVVTGHRGLIEENVDQELHQYLEIIYRREEEILDHLDGKTVEELADEAVIYREFPDPEGVFKFHETVMIRKHLERLERQDRAEQANNKWYPA